MTAREPYARMTEDDARGLAIIITDVYEHPNWRPHTKHERVRMLLNIFAGLSVAEGVPFPTTTIEFPVLADASGMKWAFTSEFALWLLEQGYLVDIGNRNRDVAFVWHVRQSERPAGGGAHADA